MTPAFNVGCRLTLICAAGIDGGCYAAQRDALVKSDIVIDLGGFADHDAGAVVDD